MLAAPGIRHRRVRERTARKPTIRRSLNQGGINPKQRIAVERESIEQFGVWRSAVRATVTELYDVGKLTRRVGHGTIANAAPAAPRGEVFSLMRASGWPRGDKIFNGNEKTIASAAGGIGVGPSSAIRSWPGIVVSPLVSTKPLSDPSPTAMAACGRAGREMIRHLRGSRLISPKRRSKCWERGAGYACFVSSATGAGFAAWPNRPLHWIRQYGERTERHAEF